MVKLKRRMKLKASLRLLLRRVRAHVCLTSAARKALVFEGMCAPSKSTFNWQRRANRHKVSYSMSPDLREQILKGGYKKHTRSVETNETAAK